MAKNCVSGCKYCGPWTKISKAVVAQYPNLEAKCITYCAVCQHPNASNNVRESLDLYKNDAGECFAGNGVAQIPWNDCVAFSRR